MMPFGGARGDLGSAVFGVLKRDFLIVVSYRLQFASQILSMFLTLTIFYYVSRLVRVESFASPDAYFAFVLVGLVIIQTLNSTLVVPPSHVRQELVAGTFERLVVSPFGAVGAILSMMLFPFIYALFFGFVVIGLGAVVFDLPVQWSTVPLSLPVAALGTFAFATFGIALIAVVLLIKQATSGPMWIVAGISLIAGLYFPVALLPDWIEWASEVQPFTPAVDLLRNLLVGTPLEDPAWLELVKIAGFAAAFMPIAVWLLGAALRTSRRRGTVIEY